MEEGTSDRSGFSAEGDLTFLCTRGTLTQDADLEKRISDVCVSNKDISYTYVTIIVSVDIPCS